MVRFVIGLVSGIAIGVGAATASQGQSGQDIRAEFERIRADLKQGDFDAIGVHLEERFKELQVSLEERFAEVEEAADAVADEAETAEEAVEEAEEALEAEVEAVEEAKEV